MSIDREVIKHLEALARIELREGEVDAITEQLNRIIGLVEKLKSVDTTDIPPTKFIAHVGGSSLREDVVHNGLPRDVILGQAPDATDEFFRVPRVFDRGEEQ